MKTYVVTERAIEWHKQFSYTFKQYGHANKALIERAHKLNLLMTSKGNRVSVTSKLKPNGRYLLMEHASTYDFN